MWRDGMKLEKSRSLWDVGVTLAQVFWATNALSHPERTNLMHEHGDLRSHVEGPREHRANFNCFSQTKGMSLMLLT